MHNSKMEIPTEELDSYFDILKDVLNDSKYLQGLPKVKDAKDKLHQLQYKRITITQEDEQRVLESLKAFMAECMQEMDNTKEENIKEIDQKTQKCFQELDTKEEEIVQKIDTKTTEYIKDLEEVVKRQREERGHMHIPVDKDYEKRTDQLRTEIMDHYKETGCRTTAVPAQMDGEEVHIDEIFVMPSMSVRKNMATGTEGRNSKPGSSEVITTIHELFKKDGQSIRRVCISGEAGQGKTTLCRKIVSDWCKVHSNSKNITNTELQFLKSFDLLFYLPLRNNKLSDVVKMIETDIVREASHNILKDFLKKESEKCLIILDGLDEWLPSEKCKDKLPSIDSREKFSVLITARPWKLEVLRPKMSEIGQEVELNGIQNDKLIEKVVKLFNNKYAEGRNWKHFKYTADSNYKLNVTYRKVVHLAEVPIMLTQMVCMWYDGEIFGNTCVEIYNKMLDYLFQVADKRYKETCDKAWMEPLRSTNTQLVNVFKDFKYCEMYSEILFKLSNLAYHTLFNEQRENSLIFPRSVTEIYELAENDVQFCLFVGILSQTKSSCKTSSQYKSFSFLHKTFQEVLAALCIAHVGKDGSFNEMLDTLISLDEVFEMSEVLIFLSGLRPDLLGDMSRHIAQLTDKDERVLQYRNSIRDDFKLYEQKKIIVRLQNIIYACIVEVPEHRMLDIKVELHDVYSQKELFDIKLEEGDKVKKMIPYLNLENVKSWYQRYDIPSEDWTKLKDLVKLGFCIESEEDIYHMSRTVKRCASSLTCLSIYLRSLEINILEHIDIVLTALKKESNLTCVKLEALSLTHLDRHMNLGTSLSQSTQLREISLHGNGCGTYNSRIDLSRHNQLQYLSVKYLDGDIVLSNEVPVECCEMFDVKCAVSILDTLKSSTNLHELIVDMTNQGYHTNSITSSTTTVHDDDRVVHSTPLCLSKVLPDVIPTLKNLRKLILRCIDFKQDVLRLSPEMTSLEEVNIYLSTMTIQCLQGFIDSLPKTQFKVWMWWISICPKEDTPTALKYITDRHQITSVTARVTRDVTEDDSITDRHQLTTEIPIGMTEDGCLGLTFTNRPSH